MRPSSSAEDIESLEGDQIMAKNAKPVKGKKTGAIKPLMKRSDLPAVKPLLKFS